MKISGLSDRTLTFRDPKSEEMSCGSLRNRDVHQQSLSDLEDPELGGPVSESRFRDLAAIHAHSGNQCLL